MSNGCTDPRCSHPSNEVLLHACREDVKKHGFSVSGVLPGEKNFPYTYTTGLIETLGHPELVVIGIDNHVARHVIHAVFLHLKKGGKITPGERVVVEGLPVRLEPVDLGNTWLIFNVTLMYYHDRWPVSPPLEVLQILVPDDQWKLPGEEGVDLGSVKAQDSVNLPSD